MSEEEEQVEYIYGWSVDQEEGFIGAYATFNEALEEARKAVGDEENVYILRGYYSDVGELTPPVEDFTRNFLETLNEDAQREFGDAAEEWPDVSKEQISELEEVIQKVTRDWVRKHLKTPAWTPAGEPVLMPSKE